VAGGNDVPVRGDDVGRGTERAKDHERDVDGERGERVLVWEVEEGVDLGRELDAEVAGDEEKMGRSQKRWCSGWIAVMA
jgi:hypothetical protein